MVSQKTDLEIIYRKMSGAVPKVQWQPCMNEKTTKKKIEKLKPGQLSWDFLRFILLFYQLKFKTLLSDKNKMT